MPQSIASKAKAIYEHHKTQLEREHTGKFVCIEPESGEFYIANSFDEAVAMAIKNHPNSVSHTIRIGHAAAFHIGLMTQ